MWIQILVGVLGIAVPIMFVYLSKKLGKIAEQNELGKAVFVLLQVELKQLASSLYEDIKKKAPDGTIDEKEQKELIETLLTEYERAASE